MSSLPAMYYNDYIESGEIVFAGKEHDFSDVLKDYLESREKEVVDIMMALFDQETALEAYLEEYAEKIRTESEARGETQAKKETALKMKEKGYPDGTIAELLEVGVSVVRQWLTEKTVKNHEE